MKIVDYTGEQFGGLYILRKDLEATTKNKRGTYWCRCDWCSSEKLYTSDVFRRPKPPVSCGCRKKEGYTHPKSDPKTKYERRLLNYARRNAKRRGEECTLRLSDIVIPERCPVLGFKMEHTGHQDTSPSVDRIDSSKGYTPDNVWIISQRANRIKNNATLEEIKLLYEALLAKDTGCVSY
jgi:hypothetical protein